MQVVFGAGLTVLRLTDIKNDRYYQIAWWIIVKINRY